MKKAFLAAVAVSLSAHAVALRLVGQVTPSSPPRSISRCSSGLPGGGPECATDRCLLIVVTMNGAEASPAMLGVIGMASSSSGAFALSPGNATSADSAVYAVMNVTRDAQGNYRIDRSIAGSTIKSSGNCRGSATGSADDMGFGAYLALETQKLVRCAQRARGAPSH